MKSFVLFYSVIIAISLASCDVSSTAIEPDPTEEGTHNVFELSQYGITWHFDDQYSSGTFANGDYWVVGPVSIVDISPGFIELNGRVTNGSMVNPRPGTTQGYDSHRDYDDQLNAGVGISQNNPLVLSPRDMLITSISNTAMEGIDSYLSTAAVLSVVAQPPAEGSFRPGYCHGGNSSVEFHMNQLDLTRLANLTAPPGAPAFEALALEFQRPWLDHLPGWYGGYLHAEENMPRYGRELAGLTGLGSLMLQTQGSDQEKKPLLINYVQLGIDLYSIYETASYDHWAPDGGHCAGRKWPILFAGIMLDHQGMKSIGQDSSFLFQEDEQTFYVSQAEIDMTHSTSWNPDERNGAAEPYISSHLGLPEWGIRHGTHPEMDNAGWNAKYRTTAMGWDGMILSALIMGAKPLWNHDAVFDYMDRYKDHPETSALTNQNFSHDMWLLYRSNYGAVWSE